MKLTTTQFSRISQYIKMFDGDRETLQNAWANDWEGDRDDYYDLTDSDINDYLTELRLTIDREEYFTTADKEFLNQCEGIYQQWLINYKF